MPGPLVSRNRRDALWSEMRFRQKVIRRIYPQAWFRMTSGGFFWDMDQPSVVLVVLHDKDSSGVHIDEEMTLLSRALDEEMRRENSPPLITLESTPQWPDHAHPIIRANQYFDLMVSCACDDEDWARDDVQDCYAKIMNKQPLDRMVEALNGD